MPSAVHLQTMNTGRMCESDRVGIDDPDLRPVGKISQVEMSMTMKAARAATLPTTNTANMADRACSLSKWRQKGNRGER